MSDCILWTGKVTNHGYGYFRSNGKRVLAHRFTFWMTHGFWPPVIHHTCETKLCINPEHLQDKESQAEHLAEHVKTHCRQGHLFTPETEYWRKRRNGKEERECLACRNLRNKQRAVGANTSLTGTTYSEMESSSACHVAVQTT